MARIQLRNTTIFLQDGLAGTCVLDNGGPTAAPDTDVTITTVALNTTLVEQVPIGARFTFDAQVGALVYTVTARVGPDPTTNITFTPAVGEVIADASGITFIAQRIEIKIGDGDLSWTEAKQFEYDLDRDQLDTVRQGEDVPLSVELAFTFEYVTTESGKPITPVDALKNINGAAEWVSSTADINPVTGLVGDACEPYAVDIYVIHDIPCGTDQDQDFLFVDFRYESLDYSIADATIAVSGQCNVTDVVTMRAANIV